MYTVNYYTTDNSFLDIHSLHKDAMILKTRIWGNDIPHNYISIHNYDAHPKITILSKDECRYDVLALFDIVRRLLLFYSDTSFITCNVMENYSSCLDVRVYLPKLQHREYSIKDLLDFIFYDKDLSLDSSIESTLADV